MKVIETTMTVNEVMREIDNLKFAVAVKGKDKKVVEGQEAILEVLRANVLSLTEMRGD